MFFKKKKEDRSFNLADFLHKFHVNNTASGEYISHGTAEALPAVKNAIEVISDGVASLPAIVYMEREKDGKKDRQWLASDPVEYLLNVRPNDTMTPFTFKKIMMRNALLTGNAYAVIKWNTKGQPVAVIPYKSGSVSVERVSDFDYVYSVTDYQSGHVTKYGRGDIIHLRHNTNDGYLGRSPVTVCRENLGLSMALQTHGSSVMKNGLMSSGILKTADWLDGQKGEQALKALQRYAGAKNAGKTPVIEGGMSFEKLGMSNQDAEWLSSRKFSIEDIGRIFNISPIFLQDYSNSTYSNFSEASRSLATITLRPWLLALEQELRHSLLPESVIPGQRYVIEFDTSELLRATPQERYTAYETAIKAGIMCPNEARQREGLPAYEGGELFSQAWLQQANLTPPPAEVE